MSHALGLPVVCLLMISYLKIEILSMFRAGIKIHVHLVDSWATSEISHNFHMAGAPIYNSPLNRPLSNNDNDNEVEIIIDVSQKYCNSVALICAPYISIN